MAIVEGNLFTLTGVKGKNKEESKAILEEQKQAKKETEEQQQVNKQAIAQNRQNISQNLMTGSAGDYLTAPITGNDLQYFNQLQGQASQGTKWNPMGGSVMNPNQDLRQALYKDSAPISQALTSTPIELFDTVTGKTIKTYNNVFDYQKDLQVISGGAENESKLSLTGDVIPQIASNVAVRSRIGSIAGTGGKALGAVIGLVESLQNIQSYMANAQSAFFNDPSRQIELGVTSKDGQATIELDRFGKGNSLSGDYIKSAQEISKEDPITWNDDGSLNVNVSPVFAQSDTFKDLLSDIESAASGLTKENDTNGEALKKMNEAIKQVESQFYYTAQQTAAYKNKFTGASDEAIQVAVDNQLAGYLGKDEYLTNYEMRVYNDKNQLVTKKASELFDEIYNLKGDKIAKDKFIGRLMGALADPSISDDSKAIIQGELDAIYAASYNKDLKYHNMLQKGFLDYIGVQEIAGISLNDAASLLSGGQAYGELQYFYDNDTYKMITGLAGAGINIRLTLKAMNATENLNRKIGAKSADLVSKVGVKLFGDGSKVSQAATWFANVSRQAGSIAGSSFLERAVDIGYQAIADAEVDYIKLLAKESAGKDVDFWKDFTQDFAMDIFFTYGNDIAKELAYSKAGIPSIADLEKVVRDNGVLSVDPDSGVKSLHLDYQGKQLEIELTKPVEPLKEADATRLTDIEVKEAVAKSYFELANEASKKAAQTVLDTQDKGPIYSIYKSIVNRNSGIVNLGYAKLAESGDAADLYKLTNIANGNEVRSRVMREYQDSDNGKAYTEFQKSLTETTKLLGQRKFTEDQEKYLIASQELARAKVDYANDKDSLNEVKKFYQPYIDAVDEDTRSVLDIFAQSMAKMARSMNRFEEDNDMRSGDFFEMIEKYPGYIPLYAKQDNKNRKQTDQFLYAETHRRSMDKDTWLKPEALESTVKSTTDYMNRVINNIAHNRQVEAVIDVARSLKGIEVGRSKDAPSRLNDMPEAEIISKYKVPQKTIDKLKKVTDSPEQFVAAIDKIMNNNFVLQNIEDYAKAKAQLTQDAINGKYQTVEGDPFLSKKVGAYTKEMTSDEIDANFLEIMRTDFEGVVNDADKRLKTKFGKDNLGIRVEDKKSAVDRIMLELQDGLEAGDTSTLSAIATNAVYKLMPTQDYDFLLARWVMNNSNVYNEETLSDPDIIEGTAGYNVKTKKKVGREGFAVRLYTDGKVDTLYLFGKTAKDKQRAEAAAEVLNAPLPSPIKNTFLRVLSNVAQRTARLSRAMLTVGDPSRASSNIARDTQQAFLNMGTSALISPRQLIADMIDKNLIDKKDLPSILATLDRIDNQVRGYTENEYLNSLRYGDYAQAQRQLESPEAPRPSETYSMTSGQRTRAQIKYQFNRFTYNAKNIFKGGLSDILATPGDIAESATRSRVGQNEFSLELAKRLELGEDFQAALTKAYEKGAWASRTATTDFSTKGTLTGWLSRWTPFSYSSFSDLDSRIQSFVVDPIGVSTRNVTYTVAYIMNLASILADEDSRKRYMNLSDYERSHNMLVTMGGGDILKIPMDETTSGFLSTYRLFTEMLFTQEPVTAWKIFGALADALPLDLSGFTEGDQFNFERGIQVAISQYSPTLVTFLLEQATGQDFYYGSQIEVDDDYLMSRYGTTADSSGDFTTKGNNSKILHGIADALNIPQWRLTHALESFGGNVAQYVLYGLDKLVGATENETGGKSMVEAFYKPFVSTTNNATSEFYVGLDQLRTEKEQLQKKLYNNIQQQKSATGEELSRLQTEHYNLLNQFAVKTNDFLIKYLSVYELTGGLTQDEARSVYYLFDFDDDYLGVNYSLGTGGSAAISDLETANKQQMKSLASTALGTTYNYGGIYQNSNGTYEREAPYGLQALRGVKAERTRDQAAQIQKLASDNKLKSKKYEVDQKISAIFNKGKLTEADYDAIDKLRYDWDVVAANALRPVFEKYGTAIVQSDDVADLLNDYFLVIGDFEVDKRGRYISAPNLNKSRGFVQQFVKAMYNKAGIK